MIIVLDPCTLGYQNTDEGGVIKVSELGGIFGDAQILIPLGEEAVEALVGEMQKKKGSSLDVSTGMDGARAMARAQTQMRGGEK